MLPKEKAQGGRKVREVTLEVEEWFLDVVIVDDDDEPEPPPSVMHHANDASRK